MGGDMELMLWRWSTLAQAVSDLLIWTFFLVLSRSLPYANLRLWARAWLCNLIALVAVALYWTVLQKTALPTLASFAVYLFAKTMFVLLVVTASLSLANPRFVPPLRGILVFSVAYAALGALLSLRSFHILGLLQSILIAVAFGTCALQILLTQAPRCGWLAAGLGMRALLGFAEISGNLALWQQWQGTADLPIGTLMAAASSLDAATEWVIALASLLAFQDIIQRDLSRANVELREAQRRLQDLVHQDQLTGVFNRRALPAILDAATRHGAGILFFDIDQFKHVNDRHGHHVGDDCLVRFADALKASFRSGDQIVRFAGDEFVVVAQSASSEILHARIEAVRQHLKGSAVEQPTIDFSVGIGLLAPGGDAEAALRKADQAMYADKSRFA